MTYELVHKSKKIQKVSLLSHHQPHGLHFLKAYFKYYLSISTIVLGNDLNSNFNIAKTHKGVTQCKTIVSLHFFGKIMEKFLGSRQSILDVMILIPFLSR